MNISITVKNISVTFGVFLVGLGLGVTVKLVVDSISIQVVMNILIPFAAPLTPKHPPAFSQMVTLINFAQSVLRKQHNCSWIILQYKILDRVPA